MRDILSMACSSSSVRMHIVREALRGQPCSIEAWSNDTVAVVKAKIREACGKVSEQLICKGQMLNDTLALDAYDICEGDVFHAKVSKAKKQNKIGRSA